MVWLHNLCSPHHTVLSLCQTRAQHSQKLLLQGSPHLILGPKLLMAELGFAPGLPASRALALHGAAHKLCPLCRGPGAAWLPSLGPRSTQKACMRAHNWEGWEGQGTTGVAGATNRARQKSLRFLRDETQPRKSKPPVLPASLGVSPTIHHGSEKAPLHSKYQKIRQHRDRGEKARPLGHTRAMRLGPAIRAPSSPRTGTVRPLQGEQPPA